MLALLRQVIHQSLRTPRVSLTSVGVVSGLGVPVRAQVLSVSQQAVRVFWSVSVSVLGSGRRWWGSPCWWVGLVARRVSSGAVHCARGKLTLCIGS